MPPPTRSEEFQLSPRICLKRGDKVRVKKAPYEPAYSATFIHVDEDRGGVYLEVLDADRRWRQVKPERVKRIK